MKKINKFLNILSYFKRINLGNKWTTDNIIEKKIDPDEDNYFFELDKDKAGIFELIDIKTNKNGSKTYKLHCLKTDTGLLIPENIFNIMFKRIKINKKLYKPVTS